jgi:hypothetical protein
MIAWVQINNTLSSDDRKGSTFLRFHIRIFSTNISTNINLQVNLKGISNLVLQKQGIVFEGERFSSWKLLRLKNKEASERSQAPHNEVRKAFFHFNSEVI